MGKSEYWRYRERGLCPRCGKPARPGRSTCQECADKATQQKRDDMAFYREHGICTRCGKAPAEHGSVCLECFGKNQERTQERRYWATEKGKQDHRAYYDKRKAQGLCVRCGKQPAQPGKVECAECAEKRRIYYKRRYQPSTVTEEREASGLCRFCGEPVVPGLKVCEKCRQRCSAQARAYWDGLTPDEKAKAKAVARR